MHRQRISLLLRVAIASVMLVAPAAIPAAASQPSNDDIQHATKIRALPFSDSESTVDATGSEVRTPIASCGLQGHSAFGGDGDTYANPEARARTPVVRGA